MQIVSQGLVTTHFGPSDLAQGARDRSERSVAVSNPTTAPSNKPSADTLVISPAAAAQLAAEDEQTNQTEDQHSLTAEESADSSATGVKGVPKKDDNESSPTGELSEEQQEVVEELKSTDREVRAHERAHLAAAGSYAKGGPTYSYQRGPDGQQYAVGGEVAIDTSPIPGDPEATIEKARIVQAAASAPAEPSSQDRAVAAAAIKLEIQATQELRQQETETTDDIPSELTSSHKETPTKKDEQVKTNTANAAGLLLDLIG